MKKLNKKLWDVAREYTLQVAELFDRSEWHWVGSEDDGERPFGICDLGDTLFLTLEDMQVIIDGLDKWVSRYGSREAVAQEVCDWFDWWLNDEHIEPDPLLDLVESPFHRYQRTRPAINLESWLAGCPREPRKPSVDDELRKLVCQREVVRELISKYREARTLWNIFDNLNAEINGLKKKVEHNGREL